MNISQELLNYIESSIKQGFTKEQITNALIANGWKKEIIDEAFKQLENKNQSNKNVPTSTINLSANVNVDKNPIENTNAIQNKQETSKKETNENNFTKHSFIVFIAIIFLAVAAVSGVFLISKNLSEKTENLKIENENQFSIKKENINTINVENNYEVSENVNFEQEKTFSNEKNNEENQEKYEYNYMDEETLIKIIEEEKENTKYSPEFREALLLNNSS
ncbi:MAG: hypothetical protein QXS41_00310 [Candidatus Woesearchaeota archaeon]